MYACNYSIRTLKKNLYRITWAFCIIPSPYEIREHFLSDFRTCDLYLFGPLAVCIVLSFSEPLIKVGPQRCNLEFSIFWRLTSTHSVCGVIIWLPTCHRLAHTYVCVLRLMHLCDWTWQLIVDPCSATRTRTRSRTLCTCWWCPCRCCYWYCSICMSAVRAGRPGPEAGAEHEHKPPACTT